MTLTDIAVFVTAALIYSLALPSRWRGWALLVGSVAAIYWLQPTLAIRYLDFVLPTVILVITVITWVLTRQPVETTQRDTATYRIFTRDDQITLGITAALVLALSATRYLAPELRLTSRPPDTLAVGLAIVLVAGSARVLWQPLRFWRGLLPAGILLLIMVFIIIKAEPLAAWLSGILRAQAGQDTSLASAIDIEWLGFSYVAFRLIHTLRDRQVGKLPALTLREYLTYVIFFPAFTAGPIDRAERFIVDLHALPEMIGLHAPRIIEGATRITVGLFKKFVVADSLALFSLSATTGMQADSAFHVWILLYVYAFRLFFDFSGYSDIAIGIGILFGIKLPENFDRPYIKNNIAAFWQSWHMTLSSWARFYVFSPLSRSLLRRQPKPSNEVIMFACHMSTMVVIGLWHGISWTFIIWAAWHGLGLFIHKLWTDRTRKWYIALKDKPRTKRLWTTAGVLITFHFVVLGWVWFALPDLETAASVFLRLFGAS